MAWSLLLSLCLRRSPSAVQVLGNAGREKPGFQELSRLLVNRRRDDQYRPAHSPEHAGGNATQREVPHGA